MYGLLLDSIQKFLCERYGERYWDKIRRRANLKNQWFVTHEVYSDDVLPDLVKAAAAELGEEESLVMRMFGEYFAKNIGHYGYARLLRVLGRDLRDFLNGLDDLHEYLRFSYPKMSPPSFFCESETEEGLILHYTTCRRKGFLQYVIGQLTTVGRIYGKDLEIVVLSEDKGENSTHFTMKLIFDNRELLKSYQPRALQGNFSIDAETFFRVFPFCILLDKDLIVVRQGSKLQEVLPDLEGQNLTDIFSIRKPSMLETPCYKTISLHTNCVFELVSMATVGRKSIYHGDLGDLGDMDYPNICPQLRLKGQMMPFHQMEVIAFFCSPVMDSPEDLYESGIFINDLAMYDSSRDIILAGSQKDPELKIALSQEKIRSAQLEESIQQTDRLLFQMIPKPIADQLRNGETPLNTCKEFPSVSILFSDIVSFTPMCSRLHPMEVVCVLNAMYVAFDRLCEVHHVYKVETIGDAYMVLCGAPVCTVHHAEYSANFAMGIIQATSKINDPSTGHSLKIRVGIHSGNVVAGVVGSTVLRYDVFGDTVNVAARMEATGEPMKVHVSEATATLLAGSPFTLKPRGSVEVKGKGRMNTFWVLSKEEDVDSPPSLPSLGGPSQPASQDSVSPPSQHASPPQTLILSSNSPSPPTTRHASHPPFSPPPILNTSEPDRPRRSSQPPPSLHPSRERPRRASQPPNSPPSTLHPNQDRSRRSSQNNPSSRPISPRPNQWPQADKQLQRFPTDAPFDYSVPPGGGGARRNTVPAVVTTQLINHQIQEEEQQQQQRQSPRRLHPQQHAPLPVSQVKSTLLHRDSLLSWGVPRNISLSKVPRLLETQPTLTELPLSGGEQQNWPEDQLPSELNLMDLRGSISISPAPPVLFPSALALREMEQLVVETEQSAVHAEESAVRARRVADAAASMLRQIKNFGSMKNISTAGGEGTSVDADHAPLCPVMTLHSSPEPDQDSTTSQCPEQPNSGCPVGQSKACPVGHAKESPELCPKASSGCPAGDSGSPTGRATELSISNSSRSSSGLKSRSESQSHHSKCTLM